MYDSYLSWLNNRITHSETFEVPGLILPDDIENFQSNVGSILSFSAALDSLPNRPEITLNMLDFDDTLHSRSRQLQMPLLQDNRGLEWNRVLKEVIWYQKVLEDFYTHNHVIRRLLGVIEKQSSTHKAFILTAGETNWQMAKCESVWINNYEVPIEVVEKGSDKPRKLLEYIIALGYIPWKIIIYEDRPEYFLESGAALSKMLQWTEIVVDKVVLSQWTTSRQIESIEQTIFVARNHT